MDEATRNKFYEEHAAKLPVKFVANADEIAEAVSQV
jgi:hypothetical protein